MYLNESTVSSFGAPDRFIFLGVEYEVSVVLHDCFDDSFSVGVGSPDWFVIIVVDDEVPVLLQNQVFPVFSSRVRSPDWTFLPAFNAELVHNQVRVLLEHKSVNTVRRHYALAIRKLVLLLNFVSQTTEFSHFLLLLLRILDI